MLFVFNACVPNVSPLNDTLRPTAEYVAQNPQPLPDFIARVYYSQEDEICTVVRQSELWVEGDDMGSLQGKIIMEARLSANGTKLRRSRTSIPSAFALGPDGKTITDDYGPPITFCFEEINRGQPYLLRFGTSNLHGQIFEYIWTLNVVGGIALPPFMRHP